MLRVAGEVDLCSQRLLHAALTSALVDLSEVTFCGARGFMILADTALAATVNGIGYVLSGLSPSFTRHACLLWENDLPIWHCGTAAAMATISAQHAAQPR